MRELGCRWQHSHPAARALTSSTLSTSSSGGSVPDRRLRRHRRPARCRRAGGRVGTAWCTSIRCDRRAFVSRAAVFEVVRFFPGRDSAETSERNGKSWPVTVRIKPMEEVRQTESRMPRDTAKECMLSTKHWSSASRRSVLAAGLAAPFAASAAAPAPAQVSSRGRLRSGGTSICARPRTTCTGAASRSTGTRPWSSGRAGPSASTCSRTRAPPRRRPPRRLLRRLRRRPRRGPPRRHRVLGDPGRAPGHRQAVRRPRPDRPHLRRGRRAGRHPRDRHHGHRDADAVRLQQHRPRRAG